MTHKSTAFFKSNCHEYGLKNSSLKITVLFSLVVMLTACKTISVNQQTQKKTLQHIPLGTIGEQKSFVLAQDYKPTAIPKFQKPVRVQLSLVPFNAATHKAYKKAKVFQNNKTDINYVDSIKVKPKFIRLEIADRLTIINSLNSNENKDVLAFLKNKSNAQLITTISIALNKSVMASLHNADEVFLTKTGINSYGLMLFKDKIKQESIRFKDGVVFAYEASNFCWQEDSTRQLKIVDINPDKCPNSTYRNAKRAKKKMNYYKL